MTTKAVFSNIRKEIISLIESSYESIQVCVAWVTCAEIVGALTERISKGCAIEIIISDDIANKSSNYQAYIAANGKIRILETKSGRFMHEKFAIFDNKNLIIGSYNWSRSAEDRNHESILITEDKALIMQYQIRFRNLGRIVDDYNASKLIYESNPKVAAVEHQLLVLENELGEEFRRNTLEAVRIGATLSTDFIFSFFEKYGAVGGAIRLINVDTYQKGFTKLFEIGRMDLSFEYTILKNKYFQLFSNEILDKAKQRLIQFGVKFDS